MDNVARMYYNGEGREVNYKEAAKWFEKAAALDNKGSIYALGLMYLNGKGVQKDKKKAWDLIEKAAKLGNPAAMQKLLSRKG